MLDHHKLIDSKAEGHRILRSPQNKKSCWTTRDHLYISSPLVVAMQILPGTDSFDNNIERRHFGFLQLSIHILWAYALEQKLC